MRLDQAVEALVTKMQAKLKETFADGKITLIEAYVLLRLLVNSIFSLAQAIGGADQTSVANAAQLGFEKLWDMVLGKLDFPGPDLITKPIAHMVLSQLVAACVSLLFAGHVNPQGSPVALGAFNAMQEPLLTTHAPASRDIIDLADAFHQATYETTQAITA